MMHGVTATALLLVQLIVPFVLGYYGDGWDKEHSGAQVWRVKLPVAHQVAVLQRMTEDLDVLHHSGSEALVHVRPQFLEMASQLVKTFNLTTEVVVEDLARSLKEEHLEEESRALTRATESCTASSCPQPLLNSYMTFAQIEWFLKSLAAQYPNNVKLTEQGKSTENRTLWLVKVFKSGNASGAAGNAYGAAERVVFVEGGIHAREWISPSTVLNILMAQTNACVAGTVCNATFYFMPIINPDGYVYSWTTDRMWRKNRSKPPASSNQYGTDLNRNFGYFWGVSGASSDTSSEVYKGPSAFSSPEASAQTAALQKLTQDVNSKLVLFLAYHSYNQLILYPWSYSSSPVPASRAKNIIAGQRYAAALLAVNKVTYRVLQAASGLYPAAGTSEDYATSLGVEQSFTVELRDTGARDFILPSSQISPTFQENWAGFKAMVQYTLL